MRYNVLLRFAFIFMLAQILFQGNSFAQLSGIKYNTRWNFATFEAALLL